MSVDIKRGRSLNQGYQKYFGISISPTAKTKHSGSDQNHSKIYKKYEIKAYNFFRFRAYFKYLHCKFNFIGRYKMAILIHVFSVRYQQPCLKTINIASLNERCTH